MLIQYPYIKQRNQFGKQCVFGSSGIIAERHVLPEPRHMQDYVHLNHRHHGAQSAAQFAAHEAQTTTTEMKSTGTFHAEGGWPREVNPRDEEVVRRFRRRVEKSDAWALTMKTLSSRMEAYVRQNSAVNIYTNFFDDMIPTPLIMKYDVRTRNLYEDPGAHARPVSHLSWSPGRPSRLVTSYSFMEFEVSASEVNPYSYIWDIENPNKAVMALKSFTPLIVTEFNPRDPSMLISGLMSGQVCNWDIRTGDKPVQVSNLLFSHREPANQALWTSSKTNTEFFSGSTSGAIKWWDIRNLGEPFDTLVMDLEDPERADIVQAIGISALQFDPTLGTRFMVGTQNGIAVNGNRRGSTPTEKLAARFKCSTGPVIAIDGNPFNTKNFLTVGDWSAKIWADDTREGCLTSTRKRATDLSGGCWSRSRFSVFFTINTSGVLEVYDILHGMHSPLTAIRICEDDLTTIRPHEDGELLAVGTRSGNMYLLECSEGLTINSRNEKALATAYLERCSRFEKTVDGRSKELRLTRRPTYDDVPAKSASQSKGKEKGTRRETKEKTKRETKERARSKTSERGKEKIEMSKKRSKGKRSKRDTMDLSGLLEVEGHYFDMIEAEAEKFTPLDDEDLKQAHDLLQEPGITVKKKEEEPEPEPRDTKKERKVRRRRRGRGRARRGKKTSDEKTSESEEETGTEVDSEATSTGKKRHRRAILRKICPGEVCKPEVCCRDVEDELKAKRKLEAKRKAELAEEEPKPQKKRAYFIGDRWYRKLSEFVHKIPSRPLAYKRRMLRLKDARPNVLRREVAEARKQVRAWHERKVFRKRDLGKPEQQQPAVVLEEKPEETEEEKEISAEEPVEAPKPVVDAAAAAAADATRQRTAQTDRSDRRRDKKKGRKGRRRRRKMSTSSEDELEKQERKRRNEALIAKIIREEELKEPPEVYPRISAAFPEKYAEAVTKNQVVIAKAPESP